MQAEGNDVTTDRVLNGRYEVGELIGRGGMADVHLGRDIRLGRSVAIKVLRRDLARDPCSSRGSAVRRRPLPH